MGQRNVKFCQISSYKEKPTSFLQIYMFDLPCIILALEGANVTASLMGISSGTEFLLLGPRGCFLAPVKFTKINSINWVFVWYVQWITLRGDGDNVRLSKLGNGLYQSRRGVRRQVGWRIGNRRSQEHARRQIKHLVRARSWAKGGIRRVSTTRGGGVLIQTSRPVKSDTKKIFCQKSEKNIWDDVLEN